MVLAGAGQKARCITWGENDMKTLEIDFLTDTMMDGNRYMRYIKKIISDVG